MPYCSRCGNQVQESDQFCLRCGAAQQPEAKPAELAADLGSRMPAIFCYFPFLGWIAAIFVLAGDSFRWQRDMRFHGFQGLYLACSWLLYHWVIEEMVIQGQPWVVHRIVRVAYVGVSFFLMFKTGQGDKFRLPVLSDLADQSLAQQR